MEMLFGLETEKQIHTSLENALERLHKVVIHNDEVTPYEFVIIVLRRFFGLTLPDAEHITYVAHTQGQALVTILPLQEAQKRVGQAHFAASLEGFPLMFTIEPE
ncbi:MAG: ATP-dependent Clp protease adaptor ClpS [Ardenticatenaceae bacterium]|nr:ATP-dependent Clp protease adaptor ClpS [Ardenticatenaceae bacterium]MCB9445274.1 ATP-dependent Clp protease adaptor ClpS [Ardenticatenaceae bacterium]